MPENLQLSEVQLAELSINRGVSPDTFVLNQVANGARVIEIGYDRGQLAMDENFLHIFKTLLKDSSIPIGLIAIDSDERYQTEVDAFLAGNGQLPEAVTLYDSKSLAAYWDNTRHPLIEALHIAKNNGIKVVCVAPSESSSSNRATYIKDSTLTTHEMSPDSLALLLSRHSYPKSQDKLSDPTSPSNKTNQPPIVNITQAFNREVGQVVLLPSSTSEAFQQTAIHTYGENDTSSRRGSRYIDFSGTILIPYSRMQRREVR